MTLLFRTATAGLNPEFTVPVKSRRPAVTSDPNRGHFRRRARVERRTRRHELGWNEGTQGEAEALRRLWEDSKGGVLPMDFTPIGKADSEAVQVCFVPETLSIRQLGPDRFAMRVEVEEMPGLVASTLPPPLRNVIVFLIDDVGPEYYACYDNTHYNPPTGTRVDPIPSIWANKWAEVSQNESEFAYPPTPTISAIAKSGLLLTRMNVAAMCSPTRASLLTGRHNIGHTLGNAIQGTGATAFGMIGDTIYELMEAQGSTYERLHIGKFHCEYSYTHLISGGPLGAANTEAAFRRPVARGCTYYQGGLMNFGTACPGYETGNTPYDQEHSNFVEARHDARDTVRFDPDFRIKAADGSNALDRETRDARRVILNAAQDNKPFLLNVWYHAVHDPSGWDNVGGSFLYQNGYHSYGTANPGGAIDGDTSHPGIVKAFTEAVDTSMGQILATLTPEQLANTMIVFITDNGSTADMLGAVALADVLEPTKPTVPASPDNPYNVSHSKRSPWQGGIGAACVISGPDVVDPGDGTAPRVWNGLVGVEDLFAQICAWTGTTYDSGTTYATDALSYAIENTSSAGRTTYIQRAFQNGYHSNMFDTAQAGAIRFVSAQNDAGWKLLWVRSGAESSPTTSPPTPAVIGETTWLWQLYDMNTDPLEASDLFYDSGSFADPTDYEAHTVQDRYDALTSGQKTQFDQLYTALSAESLIPPGMTVSI